MNRLRIAVVWVLLIHLLNARAALCADVTNAQPNAAVLMTATGEVKLNTTDAIAGTVITAGDQLWTNSDDTARLVLPGAAVIVASRTLLHWQRSALIELVSGMLVVRGAVAVDVGELHVVPLETDCRYFVLRIGERTYVESFAGRILAKLPAEVYHIKSGSAMVFEQDQQSADQQRSGETKAKSQGNSKEGSAKEKPVSKTEGTQSNPKGSTAKKKMLGHPIAAGIAAGAAVITGIVVNEASRCAACVPSPSQ